MLGEFYSPALVSRYRCLFLICVCSPDHSPFLILPEIVCCLFDPPQDLEIPPTRWTSKLLAEYFSLLCEYCQTIYFIRGNTLMKKQPLHWELELEYYQRNRCSDMNTGDVRDSGRLLSSFESMFDSCRALNLEFVRRMGETFTSRNR